MNLFYKDNGEERRVEDKMKLELGADFADQIPKSGGDAANLIGKMAENVSKILSDNKTCGQTDFDKDDKPVKKSKFTQKFKPCSKKKECRQQQKGNQNKIRNTPKKSVKKSKTVDWSSIDLGIRIGADINFVIEFFIKQSISLEYAKEKDNDIKKKFDVKVKNVGLEKAVNIKGIGAKTEIKNNTIGAKLEWGSHSIAARLVGDKCCILVNMRINAGAFFIWRSVLRELVGITVSGVLGETIWKECQNIVFMCKPLFNSQFPIGDKLACKNDHEYCYKELSGLPNDAFGHTQKSSSIPNTKWDTEKKYKQCKSTEEGKWNDNNSHEGFYAIKPQKEWKCCDVKEDPEVPSDRCNINHYREQFGACKDSVNNNLPETQVTGRTEAEDSLPYQFPDDNFPSWMRR